MTATHYIRYHKDGFWVYDVAQNIFLKHLIDRANHYLNQHEVEWLRSAIEEWKIDIIVQSWGLRLDEHWIRNQIDLMVLLIDEVCERLSERSFISAAELKSWNIFPRGYGQYPTEPVIELGHAIQALLREELPAAPEGMRWFYGTTDGRRTIESK